MRNKSNTNTIFLLLIFKYIFVSYFLVITYAAILGKQGVAEYALGSESLIEEYLIAVIILIFSDIIKLIIRRK